MKSVKYYAAAAVLAAGLLAATGGQSAGGPPGGTRQGTAILHTFLAGSQPGWQLVSSPYGVSTPLAILGVYGAVLDPTTNTYTVTPTPPADQFRPGQGYWLYVDHNINVPGPGVPVDASGGYTIPLKAGWNQVGNPFTVAVPLSNLSIPPAAGGPSSFSSAVTAQQVSPLYQYDPTTNTYASLSVNSQLLQPWAGSWLYSLTNTNLVVAPPFGGSTGGSGGMGGIGGANSTTGMTNGSTGSTNGSTGSTSGGIGITNGGITNGSTGITNGGATTTGSPGPADATLPRSTQAKWTVLVYLNAANNLEEFSVENLRQMEQARYSSDVNIVVEWKRLHESGTAADLAFDPSGPIFDGTRRYWLTGRSGPGGWDGDQIQDLGSGPIGSTPTTVDMGDWKELRNFIDFGQHNFPAQHYLVVIWNHGAGWEHRAAGRSIPHRGLSYDDDTNNSIETWQLPQAFTGLAPVDTIAMDCSLMQMLEVDYQLRNVTTYIVGSEDSPPGDGYPYQLWLPNLTMNPSMDPLSLARLICDTHGSFYLNNPDSSGILNPVTQSVVATSALPAVAQALSSLGSALLTNRIPYAAQFAAARDTAHLYATEGGTTSSYAEYKDLFEYCTLLEQKAGSAPGVTQAAEAVKSAVGQAVLDNQAVREDSFSHGISIYVPVPAAPGVFTPQSYDPLYTNLDLASDTTWNQWIKSQVQ